MPNITVFWYRRIVKIHHANLRHLMKFYDRVIVPPEYRQAFKAQIVELADLFNSAFTDEYNAKMKERRENENTDSLPF